MAAVESRQVVLSNDENLTIRHAMEADAPQVLALCRSIVEEGGLTLAAPDEFERTEERQASQIKEWLESEDALCLVGEVDGRIVGMARVEADEVRSTAHFGDISDVWVYADWRKRGIGRCLMQGLVDWATAHPRIEKLGLFVFSTSQAAQALYRSVGFEEEGRSKGDMKFDDLGYVDTVIMRLWVKPRD